MRDTIDPPSVADGADPYEVLGVRRGSGDKAIASAYRRLARRHHPDLAGEDATADMMRINAAFDTIRTAARRAAYDETASRSASTHPTPDRHQGGGHVPDRDRLRWTPERDGTGGAGPPPGRPSGSVLDFGRHIGWSIGEIARIDPGYLEWLEGRREGRRYLDEIDVTLCRIGYREVPRTDAGRSMREDGR